MAALDSDFLAGYSRSVALDDFDDPSSESENELGTAEDGNKKEEDIKPPRLPAWISWNPMIAEHLLKPKGARLDMRYLVVAVGQRACDVIEALIDIDKLTVNGALFLPNVSHATRPHDVSSKIASEQNQWMPLEPPHSSPDTNFIYTSAGMEAVCCLFHTAGQDNRRPASSAVDAYPVGSSLGKQLLDGTFNTATLNQVVIFEVLPADRYIGDRPASDLLSSPVVRCLKTTKYYGPDLNPVVDLEPPNLVSGLSADLLCRCEVIRQSAALLTCYSDANSAEILYQTYEPLVRLLSKTIFFSMRFKNEAEGALRKISQRYKNRDTDDLASLYI